MENENKLYQILQVQPNCTPSELKSAYYKLAKEHHPDKNPNSGDKFKEISNAYEILLNLTKKNNLKSNNNEYKRSSPTKQGPIHDDLFSQIFNSSKLNEYKSDTKLNQSYFNQKGKDVAHKIKVSLSDLYKGKIYYPKLTKNVLCETCFGTGSPKQMKICESCQGSRFTFKYRPVGPMLQRTKVACNDCKGLGEIPLDMFICRDCNGAKVYRQKRVFQVNVEKGMRDGQRITFEKEGDQAPLTVPGNIIFILEQKPHEKFTRVNNNLNCEIKIKLCTALCGGRVALKHLDDRDLLINILPGEILRPGDAKCIHGEGMPIYQQSGRGDLIIKFDIEFPSPYWLTPGNLGLLSKLLPPEDPLPPMNEYEEVVLSNTNSENINYENESPDPTVNTDKPCFSGVQCGQQ